MNVPVLARHSGFLSLLFTWIGLGIVLSLAVYTAERAVPGASINTPMGAVWWGVGALTTVGSELFPVTEEGRIAAMLLTLLGAFIFAGLTATITSFLIGDRAVHPDVAGQLERIKALHAGGTLTADEFNLAKAQVLGAMSEERR